MYKIFVKNENRYIFSRPDETILQALRREGMVMNAPCGGLGKCGKCKVLVEGKGQLLACQEKAEDGMVIDTTGAGLDTDQAQILTESFVNKNTDKAVYPLLRYVRIPVRPCPAGESVSDWTRFKEGASVCPGIQADHLQPDPAISSLIGPQLKGFLRSHKGESGMLYAAIVSDRVLHVSAEPFPAYMAAFDIGTTTVAGYLINTETGQTAATVSCMNPQAQYGADVIARANYTLEHEAEPVSRCIREALNELLSQMARQARIISEDIYLISIAGNTCMHHLFLGISVDSLVHAPYNPAVSERMMLRAADYGIHANPRALLAMLPNIAGFVGADTVACLVSSKLAEQKEWTLLIDIGTNGEMVLGKEHRMAACSTAAGPAFEGAGISCGMRGAAGAISKALWEEDHWAFEVIGNEKIRGICGSGLLDITAQLLESGQMDETGDMDDIESILLASPEQSATGKEIRLLRKDIRQLQLAKAAIATGVRLLAKKMSVDLGEIRQVWLAGAFGSFLSPDSACTIGLIPPELRGRIRAIGNAAGEGARDVLLDGEMWDYAAMTAHTTEFLELASMPEFNDTFIDEIMFPEAESN